MTTTTKAPTTKAPAKKAAARKPAVDAVPMATCPAGQHEVPVRSFPTEQRAEGKALTECRRCRDARYAAAKVSA